MVPFAITVCGISELENYVGTGVSHVLSILDPPEAEPAAFYRFDPHQRLDLRFNDIIEESPGYLAPQESHVRDLLAFGRRLDRDPKPSHLLVHCHMGISRSSASMMLLLAQALPDRPAEAIAQEILRIRPQAWPNLRIITLGDEVLERKGELIAAARGIYRRRAAESPDAVRFIREAGRLAEVEGLL
jgi:predicted protein tyrosine phosphatase